MFGVIIAARCSQSTCMLRICWWAISSHETKPFNLCIGCKKLRAESFLQLYAIGGNMSVIVASFAIATLGGGGTGGRTSPPELSSTSFVAQ
jgi:hypothetical protein